MSDPIARRIWDTALGHLQLQVTRPNYDTWLKETVGLAVDENRFVVGTPTDFVSEWLTSKMRPLIARTVGSIIGHPVEVVFQVVSRNGQDAEVSLPLAQQARNMQQPQPPFPTTLRLNQHYTFPRFIVGECNRLAATAALTVAERPGTEYNPLFIYGPPGLGKTHLLQAIAHRLATKGQKVLYVTAEQFTNEFITALAQGRNNDFRRRYRSTQTLLVDDIQFLGGKDRTQEEFFYTFNDLHAGGSQIVLSSDRPPHAIPGLEARLSSRFQWGLLADIQPPSRDLRLAILQAKAREQHIDLPHEVAELLAQRAQHNIRELEGLLNRVLAFARLTEAPISLAIAHEALSALTPASPKSPPSGQAVIQAVASYFNLSPQAIAGKRRTKALAEARHIAMYLLREDAQLSLKQIGFLLGSRDHSTVIHGYQKISTALSQDQDFHAQLHDIRKLYS